MKVPFLDLKAQYIAIKDEITAALEAVLESTAFAGGPFVEQFEQEFAQACGARHAIGVGNGTDALWLALLAYGIGAGDEVITTPSTFIATAEAISLCGALPVFSEVDPKTGNLNPALLGQAITKKTKAIIPVHLYGHPADMAPILEIACEHNLIVIEDACQAHGALYQGRPVGSIGQAGCFSFYPGKNLGAYGEAGAIVTDADDQAKTMRMFRDHGQRRKYYHTLIGWNARMDGIQAAVLSVKLRHLAEWTEARRRNAKLYTELLQGVPGVSLPQEAANAKHVYHIYPIQVPTRDDLLQFLGAQGIACGIHYPVPIHLQEAYRFLGYKKGDFPVAEQLAAQELSLPMYPELRAEQIHYVADKIKEFVVSGL